MGQYIYPPINPIWMNPVVNPNPLYNTLPFDMQPPKIPYAQKVKKGLPTKLQVLSDYPPTLKVYQCNTGVIMDTIAPSTPATSITGQTFTVYEFTINWNDYPTDQYYIEIQYNKNGGTVVCNYSLQEAISPNFIDANIQIKNNGNV